MPRRATLTYTSEDARARGLAPGRPGADQPQGAAGRLKIYYCRATGAAALATDADLASLPTRRTDGASILDTSACALRLYAEDAGTVVLSRRGYGPGAPDTVEVQRRLAVGGVPVAYRAGGGGGGGGGGGSAAAKDLSRFLYILPDALSPHLPGTGGDGGAEDGGGDGGLEEEAFPPVALKLRGGGCQLAVRLAFMEGGEEEEGAAAAAAGAEPPPATITGVTPERVSVGVPACLRGHEPGLRAAVAAAVSAALDVRRSAVAVQSGGGGGGGGDSASRIVLVTGVAPPEAFEMLVAAAAGGRRVK